MIALSLAVLGIVVGGAGLYFGMTANQRVGAVNDSVEQGTSSSVRLEKEIEKLNTQIAELSAIVKEQGDTTSRVRTYTNTNERAIKQLASSISEDRLKINELNGLIAELGKRSFQATPAPVAASESDASSGFASPATSTASAGTYTIESGDTFARVASKTGVSLQALLDANPDADPRRLRIGQVIQIPGN